MVYFQIEKHIILFFSRSGSRRKFCGQIPQRLVKSGDFCQQEGVEKRRGRPLFSTGRKATDFIHRSREKLFVEMVENLGENVENSMFC